MRLRAAPAGPVYDFSTEGIGRLALRARAAASQARHQSVLARHHGLHALCHGVSHPRLQFLDWARLPLRHTRVLVEGVQITSIFRPRATPKASNPAPRLLVEAGTTRRRGLGGMAGLAEVLFVQ